MTEKDPEALSWALRFILTAVSFLAFSGFIKLIGGSPSHIALFTKIGLIALGLAAICHI